MLDVRIDPKQRIVIAESVHARTFDNELIVLDLGAGEYYALDAIGSAVWGGFADGKCAEEIARGIVTRYDVEFERALADVIDLGSDLVSRGLFRIVADGA
jgi:hypothetical protein